MKKCLFFFLCWLTLNLYAYPLPAEEVFKVEAKKIDARHLRLEGTIKTHNFLYSDSLQLIPEAGNAIRIEKMSPSVALQQKDKQGHLSRLYKGSWSVLVEIGANQPGEKLLYLHYRGCADDGFCYPPQRQAIRLFINKQLELTKVALGNTLLKQNKDAFKQSEQIDQLFNYHAWPMRLLIFFGLGLLLSFTPCVLPMIPVLSGLIIGHGKLITTRKAFFLSLSYVLSMSVTYACLGAVIALLGVNLQISMQSPWAIGLLSLIFILLALSMFGLVELKLPNSWQEKIRGSSSMQREGHYLGAAIMGCLSILILSPCVSAPLIGVLTYIAQTKDVLLGALTLFFLSLGMGTPLLLIGTSAGKFLPQSGPWMNAVQAFFGLLLIAVAIYLLERIMPTGFLMLAWACLLVFSGIYVGALTPSRTHQEKFCQGVGILLLGYGLLILVGLSRGSTNPLQPLALQTQAWEQEVSKKEEVPAGQLTLSSLLNTIEQAKGRPVMLDFYASWCTSCKIMEATTLQNQQVREALSHFKTIQVDVSANNANDQAIMKHFQVVAPPTFLFFDKQGKELTPSKWVGEGNAEKFLEVLEGVLSS